MGQRERVHYSALTLQAQEDIMRAAVTPCSQRRVFPLSAPAIVTFVTFHRSREQNRPIVSHTVHGMRDAPVLTIASLPISTRGWSVAEAHPTARAPRILEARAKWLEDAPATSSVGRTRASMSS
jgi:hypothetical protein